MYSQDMKITKYPETHYEPMILRDVAPSGPPAVGGSETMVRMQIYLTRAEHEYLQTESARRQEPMAAVIRSLIDDRMALPEDAWTNNPLLEPAPHDPNWVGHEDASVNHDHYVYGAPKRVRKRTSTATRATAAS